MSSRSEPSESRLEVEARQWLVRLNSGRARSDDHQAIARWRAQSAEHDQAFRQMEEVWRLLGNLGSNTSDANARIVARKRRKRAWMGAVAASLVAVAIVGWMAAPAAGMTGLFADVSTAAAQTRIVTLDDGSRVTLNGASAANWQISSNERRVDLLAGEAYFEVAPDPARPFHVRVGSARIQVTGTAFAVQRLMHSVTLAVSHGRVIASTADGNPKIALTAGQTITWSDDELRAPRTIDPEAATAWLRGRLIVRDEGLEDIATQLTRYRRGRILLVSERARRVQVTGVFDTEDPDRILATIAQSQGVQVYRLGPLLTVIK